MARLFLHIGAHKTATSYLQALFDQNRAALARRAIHYPLIGPNNAHHALAAPWVRTAAIPDSFFGAGGPEALWDKLVAQYADAPGTLVLSAENFSRIEPECVDIGALSARLRPFDEVRLVYTMRAQGELVQSTWMQIARERDAPSLPAFVKRAFDKRLGGGMLIDHNMFYDRMLKGFAPAEIILLDYGQARRADGGIGQVFLDLLGGGVDMAELAPPPKALANVSPDPLSLYVASRIAGQTIPPADLVEIVAGVIHPDPAVPTTLLSRAEHARFRSRFAPGNAVLAERVQTVQPGFSFEEPDAPENMLYRDDLSEAHWAQVAAALYERLPPPAASPLKHQLARARAWLARRN